MKLTDLHPRWIDCGGFSFDCPVHGAPCRIGPMQSAGYVIDGADFATISVRPSLGYDDSGHGHWTIANGQVLP